MRVSEPREIASGLLLLTSGSGPMASNFYLVRSGAGWALVDCGWGGSAEQARGAVERVLGPGVKPSAILLTHIHRAHSGAAGALGRVWEVPVYAHRAELPMATGKYISARSTPLDRWLAAPLMWRLPARTRRRIEAAGDITDLVRALPRNGDVPGLPGWAAVPTPGHTAGHVAYWRAADGVLISGDAVTTLNLNSLRGILLGWPDLSGPPWYTTWNMELAQDSVTRLAGLGPRLLAPGHGQPLAFGIVPRLRSLAAKEPKARITSRRRAAGAPGAV